MYGREVGITLLTFLSGRVCVWNQALYFECDNVSTGTNLQWFLGATKNYVKLLFIEQTNK